MRDAQNVCALTKVGTVPNSNKRRGAHFIFGVSSAALIRGRRLFEGGAYLKGSYHKDKTFLIEQFYLRHEYFFMAYRLKELKNGKILKRELNERVSRYAGSPRTEKHHY